MNASSPQLYTNELTPELLQTLDQSPFTEEQLNSFDEHTLTIVNEQKAYASAHPPIAIYRIAAEGSQTRGGGVVKRATGRICFTLDNGQEVCSAKTGDYVEYLDGTKAHIVTGAGKGNSDIALMGSFLSNKDEIINTPQSAALIVAREGVPKEKDFLPTIEH